MAAAYPNNVLSPMTGAHAHPYLQEPLLYLSNLPSSVMDQDLANALQFCVPFRPAVDRDSSGRCIGTASVVFKYIHSAEKALATLQSRPVPNTNPPALMSLSPFAPANPPISLPPPHAQPLLIKQLPDNFSDSDLYDLFRPFGTLASVRTNASFGPNTGIVEFFFDDEAHVAKEAMHCYDVQGTMIAVQFYQPRKGSGVYADISPNAPVFIPSTPSVPFTYTQSTAAPSGAYPPLSPTFIHGPGQQVQLAPLSGPGSNSHSGLIDPCNLFIKNLDPNIDSNALFSHFRTFGQIVSARVMRNEQGQSRGFGFVSFQSPDQSAQAMHTMNGMMLGGKQVIVRLHEPKQLRQEKLAQRFGGKGNHPRSSSGATSPTSLSDDGASYAGWPSPGHAHPGLGGVTTSSERVRRSSGSYYHAALSGTLDLPMQYDELSALSPVVRREVLSGELHRRLKDLEDASIPEEELDSVIDGLINLGLADVVEGIHNPAKLSEHVEVIRHMGAGGKKAQSLGKGGSPAPSQDSRVLDPQALIATASAPEHPSTPLSLSGSISDPPRSSSPGVNPVAAGTDKERLLAAVTKLEPAQAEAITDMLMHLSKRERAMCLFSAEILRKKVSEVKEIFTLENEPISTQEMSAVPSTPVAKRLVSGSVDTSPRTPDLSSKGPSTVASPMPVTPGNTAGETHTIASLAKLPAQEVVNLARNLMSSSALPLPKADPLVTSSTDQFIDSLQGQQSSQQKQAVGQKLFKFVKATGATKQAGKVTIHLLDTEELRSLTHLMNSYPDVLKEKVQLVSKSLTN